MLQCGLGCAPASTRLYISPGATIVREARAVGGSDVLEIEALAGQTLLLGLNNGPEYVEYLGERSGKGGLRVLPPGGSESRALPSRGREDSDYGTWINVLPKTGVYHVLVQWSSSKPYLLRITLMDRHDPRLDPGITVERVSIDWSALGAPATLTLRPFEPMISGTVDDFWPAHLAAVTSSFQFRIMALDGIKKMQLGGTEWLQGISRLESALRAREEVATPDLLPLSGYQDAALYFWGQQERLEGKAWSGLRWIGWYSQGGLGDTADPIPLNYVFEAVSRDGRYFIMMFANVEYRNPPGELLRMVRDPSQLDGSNPSPKAYEEQLHALQPKVRRYLNEAEPSSFRPSVRGLDALARSIELK